MSRRNTQKTMQVQKLTHFQWVMSYSWLAIHEKEWSKSGTANRQTSSRLNIFTHTHFLLDVVPYTEQIPSIWPATNPNSGYSEWLVAWDKPVKMIIIINGSMVDSNWGNSGIGDKASHASYSISIWTMDKFTTKYILFVHLYEWIYFLAGTLKTL